MRRRERGEEEEEEEEQERRGAGVTVMLAAAQVEMIAAADDVSYWFLFGCVHARLASTLLIKLTLQQENQAAWTILS